MRAASNVLLRDVNVSLIIDEMYSGANVIYADFTDYDELAHHCGPERVESFEALDGIDRALAALEKAAANAPRPYKFVVLSDHGQSLGATFKQRYGKSLGDVVLDLMGGRATVIQATTTAEGGAFVNSFLSEVTRAKGIGPAMARAALAGRTTDDGMVHVEEEDVPPPADASAIAVVGSGNLGLIWFTGNDHRLTLEELEEKHPGLVAALAAHPGVSMLMVKTRDRGSLVIGHNGVVNLDDGEVEGEDPMAPFGPNTLLSMRREDEMEHAPDLLLISEYNPALGEVAAFEELIGSHGGLGGPQTEPFILHPVDWTLDEEVPLGAPAVYRNLRRWLSGIGIELGKPPAAAPAAVPRPGGPRGAGPRARLTVGGSEVQRRPDPPRLGGTQDEHRRGRVLDRDAHRLVERELVRARAAGRGPGDQLAELGAGVVRADDPPFHRAGELDGARGRRRERGRARLDDEHGVADRVPVHLALARRVEAHRRHVGPGTQPGAPDHGLRGMGGAADDVRDRAGVLGGRHSLHRDAPAGRRAPPARRPRAPRGRERRAPRRRRRAGPRAGSARRAGRAPARVRAHGPVRPCRRSRRRGRRRGRGAARTARRRPRSAPR